MKRLLKAWKEYKGSLVDKVIPFGLSDGPIVIMRPSSFEGFMDYLVNKESKRKKK